MLHDRAIQKLLHFINVKEGNIRYLGLDAMTRLAKISKTHKKIKGHLRTIRYSLDDNDISIRKRALDLLYGICDEDNVVEIIDHLLRYLNKAEYDMREDMVLKIAVLAEKYATDLQWYINVVLQLLTMAGDFVAEDVWHRVIQIVTNNEDLQKYSVEKVLETLNVPPVHESTIKVAGYILGEFGHLLENVSGKQQFDALHKHFQSASVETKALLLSTFMKFVNLYPEELLEEIVDIFKSYNGSVDPELQQRAVEYQVMATYDDQDLIGQVWEAMPDFPERESNLMKIVRKKAGASDPFSDLGSGNEEKDDDSDSDESNNDNDNDNDNESESDNESENDNDDNEENDNDNGKSKKHKKSSRKVEDEAPLQATTQAAPKAQESDLLSDLFGGDILGSSTNNGGATSNERIELEIDENLYKKSLLAANSILYDDQKLLRFGMKSVVDGGTGLMKILFVFGNRGQSALTNVKVEFENSGSISGIDMQFASQDFRVEAEQEFQLRCRASFNSPSNGVPVLKISFNTNGINYILRPKVPVVATKFFRMHNMNGDQFKQQWTGNNQQAQGIVSLNSMMTNVDMIRNVLTKGMNVGLIDAIEKNPNNSVGCSVCHFAKKRPDGNNVTMGVLIRYVFVCFVGLFVLFKLLHLQIIDWNTMQIWDK